MQKKKNKSLPLLGDNLFNETRDACVDMRSGRQFVSFPRGLNAVGRRKIGRFYLENVNPYLRSHSPAGKKSQAVLKVNGKLS
jgi:hypothetical protein